jgi:DNA (cytosine-5)-methyltransferase 1
LPNGDELSDLPVVEHILTNRPSLQEITTARQRAARTHHFVPRPLVGNLDLAVLRAESQNPTHVTPLIATLASGFFNEQLVVIGPPPRRPNRALMEQRQKLVSRQLRQFVYNTHKPLRKVGLEFHKTQRLKRGSLFYKSVDIDHHRYTVCTFFWFVVVSVS